MKCPKCGNEMRMVTTDEEDTAICYPGCGYVAPLSGKGNIPGCVASIVVIFIVLALLVIGLSPLAAG